MTINWTKDYLEAHRRLQASDWRTSPVFIQRGKVVPVDRREYAVVNRNQIEFANSRPAEFYCGGLGCVFSH